MTRPPGVPPPLTGMCYADLFRRRAINVEVALDIAVDWHRQGRENCGITACVGMSVWERQ